jgi:hypothetical protein
LKTVVFLCGLFALAAIAWMLLLPTLVERELRSITGFDIRVEVLAANPFTGHVSVRGLSARNPVGYPVPEFVELRELRADVNEFSWLLGGRLVVDDLYLDAGSIQIVRRHDGRSNAGDFAAAFSPGEAGGTPGAQPLPAKPFQYLIRTLHLRLSRLVIADYSGSDPEVKVYNLDINHTFSNVSDPRQLLVPEIVRSLYSFGLRRDTEQLLPGGFGHALADAVGAAAHVGVKLKDATQKTGEYFKGLLDKLEQSAKP